MALEPETTMYKFLLKTKAELMIRQRKRATKEFKRSVAIGNIIHAIDKVLDDFEREGDT
jgi:hypothetical protein